MSALIVDDEPEICILLKAILKGLNYSADYSITLEDGLEKKEAIQPDIVFLDMNLPDGNGISKIKDFKNGEKSPKVIMISAYDMPGDRANAFSEGVDYFLSKPFTRQQIKETLQNLTLNSEFKS